MDLLGANLVFEPPPWTTLLRIAAVMGMFYEAVLLCVSCRRGHALPVALALTTAGMLAGPALVVVAVLMGMVGPSQAGSSRRRVLLGVGLRGTLIDAMACLVIWWSSSREPGAVLALGAMALLWALRSYARTTNPLPMKSKVALLAMRIAVLALLVFWAAGVGIGYTQDKVVRGIVLIGVDNSSSMQRRDMTPALTPAASEESANLIRRIDAVREALSGNRADFHTIAEHADVEWFTFAAAPTRLDRYDPDDLSALKDASGTATALGDSTASALDWYAGKSVAAILLISDGCNNTSDLFTPEKLSELMGSRAVPIYTAGVGNSSVTKSTQTLVVKDLASPDEVEAFNRLPIAVTLETLGLGGKRIQVACRFADKEVDSQEVHVEQDRTRQTVQFVHVPLSAGFQRLSVSAKVVGQAPRGLGGLDEDSKLVHVTERDLRVLYVEGKFRYETKYIVQALAAAQRFKVDRRVLGAASATASGLGDNLDDWLQYHAIILGDVKASQFTPRQLQIMKELVGDYGKGLGMIGGSQSFGRGGWSVTPVADLMPVDLAQCVGDLTGQVRLVPTPSAKGNGLMQIGEDDSKTASAWAELGPLSGANRLAGVKPGALVVGQTPGREPLVVWQQYGKGRSLAIAFDTTWQWVLTPKDTAAYQRRFWRQVALFLANPTGNVWITTDRPSYDLQRLARGVDSILATAGVEDSKGKPMPDVPVTVTLKGPDGKTTPVSLAATSKMRSGRLTPPGAAGTCTLQIVAQVEGKELKAEHRFDVTSRDLEALDVLANPALLQRMSDTSSGKYVPLARLSALLGELRAASQPKLVPVEVFVNFSRDLSWPIIAAMLFLLCLEWAMRKRMGLV